jgi:hypothetical protein
MMVDLCSSLGLELERCSIAWSRARLLLDFDESRDRPGLSSINQLEKAAASCLILTKNFAAEYAKGGCHFDLNFNIET